MSWDKEDVPSWKVYAATLVSLFFGVILALILIRIYNYVTLRLCYSQTNLRGKTVLITGANSGEYFRYHIFYSLLYNKQ